LVTAPLLRSSGLYSNFWAGMGQDFYYLRTDDYKPILERKELDCFQVPMVHSALIINLNMEKSRSLTFWPEKLANYRGPDDDLITFAMSAKDNMHLCNQKLYGHVQNPGDSAKNVKLEAAADFGPIIVEEVLSKFAAKSGAKNKLSLDHVYLINLPRRPDRLAKMKYCFDQLSVDYELVEAVDGKKLTESDLKEKSIRMMPDFEEPYHGRAMTFGEVGCFLSHFNIWQEVLTRGQDKVLVFEDDIRFEANFRAKLESLLADLQESAPDWDLVFLGRKILSNQEEPWVSNLLVKPGYTYWTLAYLLSKAGAEKLLNAKPLRNLLPVDEFLPIMYAAHPNQTWSRHFAGSEKLNVYSAAPLMVHPTHYTGEDGYVSDTEDTDTVDNECQHCKEEL